VLGVAVNLDEAGEYPDILELLCRESVHGVTIAQFVAGRDDPSQKGGDSWEARYHGLFAICTILCYEMVP
jgi:hypothetical protein